jgi:transcription elongation factor/antiterminator RfaH
VINRASLLAGIFVADRSSKFSKEPEMSAERQWYVLYTKPQKEEYARFHLSSKGLDVFFPQLLFPQSAKKRKRRVPLFPNYLFVRLSFFSDELSYARWSPGVSRIVSFNGVPAALDEDVVTFIMRQANSEGIITARSKLKAGEAVRVSRGPFQGVVGIIQEPPNARGRVKILLELLSRQVRAEVPVEYVEGGWVVDDSQRWGNG